MAEKKPSETTQQTEASFFGLAVDPTPNENYTVAGVASGKPTPETDEKAAAKAAEAGARSRFTEQS